MTETKPSAEVKAYCKATAKIKTPAGMREGYMIQFVSIGAFDWLGVEHRQTWTIVLN